LTTWAELWLQAFAAILLFLVDADPACVRRELQRMARFVSTLVFLHVALRFRPPRPKTWRHPVPRAGMLRAVKGGCLRRRLDGRDPVARFFAILSVMRDLDAEIARLLKRLARGLTRLRVILPERSASALAASALTPVCAADTS